MRPRKTITAVPIILLALLPCLYCAYFQVKEHLIWLEMEEKMERSNLQTVTVPVKDFRWYEENREIIVDGMMFDVKSIERKGNNYIITGLFDAEETALHIAMGKLQEQERDGSGAELVGKVLSQNIIVHSLTDMLRQPQSTSLSPKQMLPDEKLYNTILSLHTPPPRTIVV
ncbi:MAG TPA: hypothetical protein VD996_00995 [Chitinophagaceae bacterium]|nr:hypothetical protein [Chitinophagaceae bacterium]